MKIHIFATMLLFTGFSSAMDDEKEKVPPTAIKDLIRVQVEYIEMPHEKLTALLEEKGDSDDAALRLKVRELIAAKDAKILETFVATTRSGGKATAGSVDEFIYPTEYEPMEIVEPPPEKSLPQAMKTPFCPTAFETRNLGSSLEINSAVDETGKIISLSLEPNMTWHTGNLVWAEDKDAFGNASKIEMPRIYSLSTNTSIACVDGKPQFVAALSPKSDRGEIDTSRKVMVFVKCDVIPVK
jgi:hypothetical protein